MKSGVEVDGGSDPGDGAAGLRDGWREGSERVPDLLFVVAGYQRAERGFFLYNILRQVTVEKKGMAKPLMRKVAE